jgi:hypothetical protein
MYTFHPLPPTYDGHAGFWIIFIITLAAWGMFYATICEEDGGGLPKLCLTGLAGLIIYIAYQESYNTPVIQPKNQQVTGNFVRYVAEGDRVSVQSGKHHRMVDRHYVYVVYEVNGTEILMQASTGQSYPKRAIMYKN